MKNLFLVFSLSLFLLVVDSAHAQSIRPAPPTPTPPPIKATCTVNRATVMVNQPVTYTVKATGGDGKYMYLWSMGGARPNNFMTIAHPTSGVKEMQVRVISANQNLLVNCPKVTVMPMPVSGFCRVDKTTAVIGETVTYTVMANGGNGKFSYFWSSDNSPSSSNIKQTSHQTTGIKYMNVRILSENQTVPINCPKVEIKPLPIKATCTVDRSTAGIGEIVNYTVSSTGGSEKHTHQWMIGVVTKGTAEKESITEKNTLSISYETLGIKNVSVKVSSAEQSTLALCPDVSITNPPISIPSTARVIDPGTFKLVYDSNQRESSLVAEQRISVTAGNRDVYITSSGYALNRVGNQLPEGKYIYPNDTKSEINNGVNVQKTLIKSPSGYEYTAYLIRAGTTGSFTSQVTFTPKYMFSGSYSFHTPQIGLTNPNATDFSAFPLSRVNTNSVLIVGEDANPINVNLSGNPSYTRVFTADDVGEADRVEYVIPFEIIAVGRDLYIDQSVQNDASPSGIGGGVAWATTTNSTGITKTLMQNFYSASSTGDTSGYFLIRDGQTRVFTLKLTLEAGSDGATGVRLTGINYDIDPIIDRYHTINLSNFRVDPVSLNLIESINFINGSCDTTATTAGSTTPSAPLCSAGIASSISGIRPWTWTCNGINGGTTASCKRELATINGSCDTTATTAGSTAPTGRLCSAGIASSVAGTGPWTWTCNGVYGGINASCIKNILISSPPPTLPPPTPVVVSRETQQKLMTLEKAFGANSQIYIEIRRLILDGKIR